MIIAFIPDQVGDKFYLNMTPDFYETIGYTDSSYNVIIARLFGVSYAQMAEILARNYNASVRGRNSKYFTFIFYSKKDIEALCKELNERWNWLLKQLYLRKKGKVL